MTDNGDRLNRIESILEGLAQTLAQVQEQSQRQFTDANNRLTRLEQSLDETRKIADSNARAIEAWSLTIEDDRAEREEADSHLQVGLSEIRQTLAETSELQQRLLHIQIQDRDVWRQQRADIGDQIQALIDNQNQDRQNWRQQMQDITDRQERDAQEAKQQRDEEQRQRDEARQRSAHIDQQIQDLIALSRQNTQAHAEFRADIQRLSDRLAG